MKKIAILLFLGMIFTDLFSNDFAPIGAKWYYSEGFAFSGDIDYILYTSEKDTLFKGQNCRKIIKRHDVYCYSRPPFELVFSKNDTIYFYDQKLDTFQILYNLNAKKGDTWFFRFKDIPSGIVDTVNIFVDSIGSITVNNQLLRLLFVTYKIGFNVYPMQYQSKIAEKIGDFSFMFNFYPSEEMACDANYSNGIRCYEDNTIGLYHFASMDSCTYTYKWTDIKTNTNDKLTLYPIPSNEVIHISGLTKPGYYHISDITGKLLKFGYINDSQILIKDLTKGIYILSIFDLENNSILNKKIIKY